MNLAYFLGKGPGTTCAIRDGMNTFTTLAVAATLVYLGLTIGSWLPVLMRVL